MQQIFYFSGTQNSKIVAQTLNTAINIENAPLCISKNTITDLTHLDVIGIVFPMYYFGCPLIVKDWLSHISYSKNAYVFIIVTKGISIGGGAFSHIKKALKPQKFQYFKYVTMGDNFILDFWDASSKQTMVNRNTDMIMKAQHISRQIHARKKIKSTNFLDYIPFLTHHLPRYGHKIYSSQKHLNDLHFKCDKSICINCQKCIKQCPVQNIADLHGITWLGNNCQMCLACFHVCPVRAIEYIDKQHKISTIGKSQYFNHLSKT